MKYPNKLRSLCKLLLPIIFVLMIKPAIAQDDLCKDPCPPGPEQSIIINLCKFHWAGKVFEPATGDSISDTLNEAYVFVIINYRVRNCNGVTSVIIDDNVYVDNSDMWINHTYPWTTPVPSIQDAIAASPCKYSAQDAIAVATQKLLDSLNLPQGTMEATFRGSCYSFVKLKFPDGSFWTQPTDYGTVDTVFFSSGSNIGQRIPCSDVCCKVKYKVETIKLENGQTESTYVAISYSGDSLGCLKQDLPDYSKYPNKLTATIRDPNTGATHTVEGTPIGQEPCKLSCPEYCLAHQEYRASINTGLSSQETPLEFSAIPTLVNNFVRFKSSLPLQKVLVYDMSGKIVLNIKRLENNEINTSELKSGVYFLQAYFSENEVKTVKILKQ